MDCPHSIHISTFPLVRITFFLTTFCSVDLHTTVSPLPGKHSLHILYIMMRNNLLVTLLILEILLPISVLSKKNGSWILGKAYAKHGVIENNLFSFS